MTSHKNTGTDDSRSRNMHRTEGEGERCMRMGNEQVAQCQCHARPGKDNMPIQTRMTGKARAGNDTKVTCTKGRKRGLSSERPCQGHARARKGQGQAVTGCDTGKVVT